MVTVFRTCAADGGPRLPARASIGRFYGSGRRYTAPAWLATIPRSWTWSAARRSCGSDGSPEGLPAQVVAKLEYMNPGGSVKDRIGLPMIEAAEREGKLRPGGTIVEPTSGNTGVGLAIAAAIRGYRCIFVMPDKMSQEKISLLRAYGAEVVVCPTAVEPESPESYYSVSDRLAEEIPGAFKPDQYSNPANPQAHYETTGPGDLGADRRRARRARDRGRAPAARSRAAPATSRSRSPTCAWSAPTRRARSTPSASVHPYMVEGIGEDFWPEDLRARPGRRVRDRLRPRLVPTARRMAREEGLLVGGSAGTAIHAALEVARGCGPGRPSLTIVPDGGRAYLSKFLNDNYMIEYGFLEREAPAPTVDEVLPPSTARRAARAGHDRGAPQGRRGDLADAALLDLAAAGGPDAAGRIALGRRRLAAASAGCSTACSRTPTP